MLFDGLVDFINWLVFYGIMAQKEISVLGFLYSKSVAL
jgi:hypothetical protein